jgi:hypothetical protein
MGWEIDQMEMFQRVAFLQLFPKLSGLVLFGIIPNNTDFLARIALR